MCSPLDPVCSVGESVAKAGQDVLDLTAKMIADAAIGSIKGALSWWMSDKLDPTVATGGAPTSVVSTMQADIRPLVLVAAVAGILVACAQVAISHRGQPLMKALFMLLTTITVTGLGAVAVQLLLTTSDSLSTTMLAHAGAGVNDPAGTLFNVGEATGMFGVWITMGPLMMITGIAQAGLMFFRAAVIPLMVIALPFAASMMASQPQWLKKISAWLLAFILYKPVAAMIYATGLNQLTDFKNTDTSVSGLIMKLVSGLMLLIVAIAALPALIKLVAPVAGTGVSSAFSGAALIGAGAMGAAVLSTGGAAAAGGAGVAAGAGASAAPAAVPPPPPTPPGGPSFGSGTDVAPAPAAVRGGGQRALPKVERALTTGSNINAAADSITDDDEPA